MKKIIFSMLALLLALPLIVSADKKVKVYMFEAGGCPYCEAEEEYLKKLDSYGKKFELIKKELYVDHVDWEKGKDYDLGVKVANGFKDADFKDASYQGTPFVIISDLYAAAGYNTSLEDVINEAYEKGDKDIVGCYDSGKDNCLNHLKKNTNDLNTNNTVVWVIIISSLILLLTYILKSNKDKKDIILSLESRNK